MNDALDLQYDRLLGEGSYGKVFLVKQQDGQEFAVKEIDLVKCDDSGREQAHGEAHLLSRLCQENILLYVESVICDECLYIVTEYCSGGDLEDYLQIVSKHQASIPESLVSLWILQLGGALTYLHDQKILHRDMKTKNIFLKDDLTLKLGDLGIAKVLDLNQSKADTFIGTPSYMSPELFSGQSYNHKTDIWGLGCCVYEMMTLTRAFQGKGLWTLIREIKNGRKLDLPDSYSLEIRTLVQEMMSQTPEDRPSAKEIVQNDLLCYHKGSKHEEVIKSLPDPHERLAKKVQSSHSRGMGGSGSGSLRKVLEQKHKSEEDKFRNTIDTVCEKINTLRIGSSRTIEEYDTFVYKGDSDSEDELEAKGTMLDKSLLKQYTEQLDTFVFKGEGILDFDSDYSTGESLKTKESKATEDDNEEDEVGRTLLKQYSESLEDEDDVEACRESGGEEREGGQEREETKGGKDSKDDYGDTGWGHSDSPEVSDNFDGTYKFVSKYQYLGLKDTMALRPDKKWPRHRSDPRELFTPEKVVEDKDLKKVTRSESDVVGKSSKSKHVSLSASLTSTGPFGGSKQRVSDPRLSQTQSVDDKTLNSKSGKVKTWERIEQSAKHKASVVKRKAPKQAFTETDPVHLDEPDVKMHDVISHLRDSITPYTSEDSQSETLRSSDDVFHYQDTSPGKGKKKKESFLKKQSEAKKQSQEPVATEENLKLFTRAQSARYTKSDSVDEKEQGPISGENGKRSIQDIISSIQNGCSEGERIEQILFVQHELTAGVGYDNLRQVVDIMSIVSDEQEMKMHIVHLLGPKLYEEYKYHLAVVRLSDGRGSNIT